MKMPPCILPALLLPILLLLGPQPTLAEVRLNPLFTDHAVLQREVAIPVWGTARDGEQIAVELEGSVATTIARAGKWRVQLPAMPAGGPHTLTVTGDNSLTLRDIWIGEVWICSGQSNMEFRLGAASNRAAEKPQSDLPLLRMFTVPPAEAVFPEDAVAGGEWVVCSPDSSGSFSAVGYFFGRDLLEATGVPVGIIHSSRGGTWAQAWMSLEALDNLPEARDQASAARSRRDNYQRATVSYPREQAAYQADLEKWKQNGGAAYEKALEDWKFNNAFVDNPSDPKPTHPFPKPTPPTPPDGNPSSSTVLYNAMIHPLAPYAIKGVAFYQGESNRSTASIYHALFSALISDWRSLWGYDFPFLFVQVAPYKTLIPELREAQLFTSQSVAGTAMVVTVDVGNAEDIHPANKEPVGQRLALAARAIAYGEAVAYSGPVYDSMTVQDNRAILHFTHADKGLVAKGGPLRGFVIKGEQGVFHPADAVIDGDSVVVTHPDVARPVAVRYGWDTVPDVNLWNGAGLPASPFRTDSGISSEPRNEAEVQAHNLYADKIDPQQYARWRAYVASRPVGEQAWLRTLEEQLGSFYGPAYIKDILSNSPNLKPEKDAWAYVEDDPALPRVLILGDSISRSYTAPARVLLKGRANVHRAPANCTRTEKFFEHGETWLMQNGSNQWDFITVNYGIHDYGKSPEQFAQNLRKIIARLRESGAQILWVRTTPWSQKEDPKDLDLSIPLNETSDALAQELGLEVIDLHSPMVEVREQLQFSDNCHFNDAGAALMGKIIARAVGAHLQERVKGSALGF